MRFVPEPGLTERVEQLGGTSGGSGPGGSGELCRGRGWRQDGGSCCSNAGSGSVAVVGRGAPDRGGPAWAALGAGWSQEMETNPFPPCCVWSKRESKAAENPGFPFLFGRRMGETRGRRWKSYEAQLYLFPLHRARCLCTRSPCPWGELALPNYFGVSTRQGPAPKCGGPGCC